MLSGSGDISSLLHFNSTSQLSTVHALLCRSRFHNAGNLLSIHFTSQTNRKPCSLGTCLAPNSTQSPISRTLLGMETGAGVIGRVTRLSVANYNIVVMLKNFFIGIAMKLMNFSLEET